MGHGCHAGLHQDALDEVYLRRIARGDEFFTTQKLGAFGADLAALAGFFNLPWRQTVSALTDADKAFVLNQAGYRLRALGRLAEAAQPLQAALDGAISRGDWQNAARGATNLSELYMTIGDVAPALKYAEQSVELADRSGDAFSRMAVQTSLADALHQADRVEEAEAVFRDAEAMQKEQQPQNPLLYSIRGFRYCDLLLGQGKYRDVQERASQTLEWVERAAMDLLSGALDDLSLGRAHLLKAQQEGTGALSQAEEHLDRAVDGLRRAGRQDHLPRCLVARAGLRRMRREFGRARHDLEEAMSIAERGGMGLHQADAHLEYARLHQAEGRAGDARESLATAKGMVERMGYHRRDAEVAELEGRLE